MVEMLIATSVLLVAVIGAYSAQLASMQAVRQTTDRSAALTDLEACLEQVMATPAEQLPIPGSAFEHGQPVAAFEGLHLQEERIVVTYPGYVPAGTVPDPLTIVLTATWVDSSGRAGSQSLRSMKTR